MKCYIIIRNGLVYGRGGEVCDEAFNLIRERGAFGAAGAAHKQQPE